MMCVNRSLREGLGKWQASERERKHTQERAHTRTEFLSSIGQEDQCAALNAYKHSHALCMPSYSHTLKQPLTRGCTHTHTSASVLLAKDALMKDDSEIIG